jgi:hypothetical protein
MKTGIRIQHIISSLTIFIIGLFFSASIVGAFSLFTDKLTRIDSQGPVEVSATFQKSTGAEAGSVVFRLALNTHSVDLNQYDLKQLSFIQFDGGQPVQAAKWEPSGSGHHFTGTLTFDRAIPQGAKKLNLFIKEIGGVQERVLEWALPLE